MFMVWMLLPLLVGSPVEGFTQYHAWPGWGIVFPCCLVSGALMRCKTWLAELRRAQKGEKGSPH